MAQSFGIEITGIADVVKELNELPKQIATQAFRNALRAADVVITPAIMAATPVQDSKHLSGFALPPGALRQSVQAKIEIDSQGRGGQLIVSWGDFSWIARLVEYGHRKVRGGRMQVDRRGRAHGPGREIGEPVPPHPFTRRAMARISEAAVEAFALGLKAGIEEMKK